MEDVQDAGTGQLIGVAAQSKIKSKLRKLFFGSVFVQEFTSFAHGVNALTFFTRPIVDYV